MLECLFMRCMNFQLNIISKFYEKTNLIIIINLGFDAGMTVFGDAKAIIALLYYRN